MRVSWLHSLSAKLFLLMSVCLLFTISGLTYFNSTKFKEILDGQLEHNTSARVREAGNTISGVMENWASFIPVAMQNISGSTAVEFQKFLENFIYSNKEFVGIQVVKQGKKFDPIGAAIRGGGGEVRFNDEKPSEVFAALRAHSANWIKKISADKAGRKIFIENMEKYTNLPLLNIAVRFVDSKKVVHWAILTVWQTRLLKALPKSSVESGYVVDAKSGRVLLSPVKSRKVGSRMDMKLLGQVTTTRSAFGYKKFEDSKKIPRILAFSRMPAFKMAVVIAKDARSAYADIKRIVGQSIIWGWVLLVGAIMLSYLASTGITKTLQELSHATQQIANGDFAAQVQPKTKDEVGHLTLAINYMASRIMELMTSQVAAARQEKELETARMVQGTLFPKGEIKASSMTITGVCHPASECGGDWWSHFTTNDGYDFVLIADATGHGAAAALVTAMAYSGTHTLAEMFKNPEVHEKSPAKLLDTLNTVMWNAGNGQTTMTLFVAMIDPKTNKIVFANSGHNMPYLLPKDENDERLTPKRTKKKRRFVSLKSKGTPLGMIEGSTYMDTEMQLGEGDKIILYTDGIIECTNPQGEMWGKRQVDKRLTELVGNTPIEIKDELMTSAFQFFLGQPLDDDITVVVIEMLKATGGGEVADTNALDGITFDVA